MMRYSTWPVIILVSVATTTVFSDGAWAVPYASGAHNIGGDSWQFVLNQDADSVTITRDGGSEFVINNAAAGRHDFDMTGFSNFEITVANDSPVGWAAISDYTTNAFELFERPNGLVVNRDPSHAMFGTIYVVNGRSLDATVNGFRVMGDGVYAMTADRIGVDLSNNFAPVADPNDSSQAKAPGWLVVSQDVSPEDSSLAAWKAALDEAGNVIVSDMSDGSGGIKWASADLTTGGLLLDLEDGILPLLTNGQDKEVHGSIPSKPYTTGSVGQDLVVYAMDEDFDLDGDTISTGASTGHHIWRWDVGDVTDYDQPPELVIDVSALPPTSEGDSNFLAHLPGSKFHADAHFEPQFNKWYLTERRDDGLEAGLIIVTADGVDGTSPTLEWSSLQFSIDNGLDGFMDDGEFNFEGIQDIFRLTGDVEISPDGSKMYLYRSAVSGVQNPYLGVASPNGAGEVLIIPLDANGLPVLEIDDNDTPADPTDDVITNIESIDIEGILAHTRQELALDAAGNLYTTNNSTELLQVFSPGGKTIAKTTSTGTFNLVTPESVPGDYNVNGVVDAADYVTWRLHTGTDFALPNRNPELTGSIGPDDYEFWKENFGDSFGDGASAGSLPGTAPEPATAVLLAVGLALAVSARRPRAGSASD